MSAEDDPIAALLAQIALDPNIKEPEPTQDTSAQDTPAHDAPAQDAPAQDAPAQEAPVQDTPAQDTPAQESSKLRRESARPATRDASTQDPPVPDDPAPDDRVTYDEYAPRTFGQEDVRHLTPDWARLQMRLLPPDRSPREVAAILVGRVMSAIWADEHHPENITVAAGENDKRALVLVEGIWREAEIEGVQAAMQAIAVGLLRDRLRDPGEPEEKIPMPTLVFTPPLEEIARQEAEAARQEAEAKAARQGAEASP